jgi:hypothetical protein
MPFLVREFSKHRGAEEITYEVDVSEAAAYPAAACSPVKRFATRLAYGHAHE